ncbi:hypothetical protein [Psychromonas hadalis]|uniref:hypothetical protein n=1 Tax=Psychromonas hadalis TaxID=211669 RepID=UPI0003B69E9E|nr:hypothetical protein [Psychromonas hadalis]
MLLTNKPLIKKLLFIIAAFFISINVSAQTSTQKITSSETYQIGIMVQAVQKALKIRDNQSLRHRYSLLLDDQRLVISKISGS